MSFAAQPRYSIGLDLGGTKILAGLVEFPSGRVLARHRVPTEASRGGRHVLDVALGLTHELHALAHAEGRPLAGVGVGIAETVDRAGRVTSHETIDWRGLQPAEKLGELGPVVIDSDARAAARAEALLGAGRAFESFLYVTVGTGISFAPVFGGRPYAGARGNAIVFANSPQALCFACGQGSPVTLERFSGGPALLRRFQEAGGQGAGAENVLAAAEAGDPRAVGVVRTAATALAGGVGALVNAFDPHAVIVGGGLGSAPGVYWQHFLRELPQYIWAPETRELPVLQSALGADAGMLGAAALVLGCV